MKQDYSQSVSMQCSTCGGSDFEFEDDDSPVRCVGCGRIYTREELTHENGARIDSEVENMKTEIVADIRRDFSKMLKNLK
ncbi:ECs_2282 family putative zinc-binding protein [Pseudophaeobacter arcticus]|uniref:ECs_2282 family putative zinc-binding protein n=1 Tax=Pseudophaeobacter arcticus TaxID=385492 RepID=UPI002491C026|nr:hypothetical protein [Pseudophaeobacter arcticus]